MIAILILLGFVVLLVATVYHNSPEVKGEAGEARVRRSTIRNLPAETYHQFHNVTLPTPYGTAQIDHIIVSRFGIFVVETKNMKGWIFGGPNHTQWTQVLFHESYKFQNPIHQNYTHIRALNTLLNVSPRVIYSVIVFIGDSIFKTPMPSNVLSGRRLISYINSYCVEILSESEVQQAATRIREVRLEPSRETTRQHVSRLQMRPRASSERKCPVCGNSMVLRIAKHGFRAGNQFWGCSRYPKCRGIQNIT